MKSKKQQENKAYKERSFKELKKEYGQLIKHISNTKNKKKYVHFVSFTLDSFRTGTAKVYSVHKRIDTITKVYEITDDITKQLNEPESSCEITNIFTVKNK